MSEEEKKQYREKKKLYMASYRRKLKEKKEETEADSAIVPGKTKNDEWRGNKFNITNEIPAAGSEPPKGKSKMAFGQKNFFIRSNDKYAKW